MTIAAATIAITLACSPTASKDQCRVVDGDTLWYQGTKIRLEGYDTPEPRTNVCGGAAEKKLAKRATARFTELINSGNAVIHLTGKTGGYGRALARITVDGEDIGAILVRERLARWWPHGKEWWCE